MPANSTTYPSEHPHALRNHEVVYQLGSQKLVRELRRAGWLKPVVQQHRLTLFDRADVARCWERLRAGETPGQPSPRPEAQAA